MSSTNSKTSIFDSRAEERDYWIEKLSPALSSSTFFLNSHTLSQKGKTIERIEINCPEDVLHKLVTVTKDSPFLLYTALFTALEICLYKYTGSQTLIIGSPALKELNRTNTLAIVDEIDEHKSFKQTLLQARANLLQAYAKQGYAFSRLVEELEMAGLLGHRSLFDVALVLKGFHGNLPEGKHGITITLTKDLASLSGWVEFDGRFFTKEGVQRFRDHFLQALVEGLNDLDKPICDISLLTDEEHHLLVNVWNNTHSEIPQTCLHHLFEAQVKQTPGAVAARFEEESLSYQLLNERANQLAHYLQNLGVGPEVPVGIFVKRSIDMVVGLLGVLKAGGAYMPLDTLYPKKRLAYMIQDAQIPVVLTLCNMVEELPDHQARIVCLDRDWSIIAQESKENLGVQVDPTNLAYILYTSGSTGKPKGVLVPHLGVVNYLAWCIEAYSVTQGWGTPLHSPIGFDLTITGLFPPLLTGRTVLLLAEAEGNDVLHTSLRTEKDFSLIKITPAHLRLQEELMPDEEVRGRTHAFVIGGEALRGEDLAFWQTHAPETRLINEYGPTETVVGCSIYEVPAGLSITGPVPIGRPINNVRIYLLNGRLEPVPVGVTGELYIGGYGVTRGYHNQPGLTAERFIPDHFCGNETSGSRLYRTGDQARYLPDGNLLFVGRMDSQVKIRGFRIELGEIETILSRHPAIKKAVGLVHEIKSPTSSSLPTVNQQLVAYVVRKSEHDLTVQELRRFLSERLPNYMVPNVFFILDTLPLTSNGKVNYEALPTPSHGHWLENERIFVAPRNQVEEGLIHIWCQAFGIEQLSVYDDFFELGGHSLLAIHIVSQIRSTFEVKLPLRSLYDAPTVAGLATILNQYESV